MSRALIYCRVSSDPKDRRVSVDSQEVENRAFCQQQGWTVVAVVVDNDRSATRRAARQREGYAEAKRRIKAGEVDVLVCWESARMTRNMAEFADVRNLCAEQNVLFAYKGRVYDLTRADDRFATGLDALVAEREADELHERVMRGIRRTVAQGSPHGTVPYGYARRYDPITRELLGQVPDEETAPVVQEIVRRIIAGDALYAIVADLNARAVPAPQQRKDRDRGLPVAEAGWSSSKIRRLMASRSMTGVRTHKGVAHPEPRWEPIVSAEDYELAAGMLADPDRGRHHRGVAAKHLLSGIAECGVCGAWLRPVLNRGIPSYRCEGHGPGSPLGKAHVLREREKLDAFVTRPLLRRLQRPDILALLDTGPNETAVAEARREVVALQARMEEYEALAVKGEVTPAAFARISASLQAQLDDARSRAIPRTVPPVVLEVAGTGAVEVWERWGSESGGILRRRTVVRTLLRIVVHPSRKRGRNSRLFDASSVELSWLGAAPEQ